VPLSRRSFLVGSGATAVHAALPGLLAQAATESQPLRHFTPRPGKSSAQLVPGNNPATPMWAYNQVVPGPEIRVTQGDRVPLGSPGMDGTKSEQWKIFAIGDDEPTVFATQ